MQMGGGWQQSERAQGWHDARRTTHHAPRERAVLRQPLRWQQVSVERMAKDGHAGDEQALPASLRAPERRRDKIRHIALANREKVLFKENDLHATMKHDPDDRSPGSPHWDGGAGQGAGR